MQVMWRGWHHLHLSEAVLEGWRATREEEEERKFKKRVDHLIGTPKVNYGGCWSDFSVCLTGLQASSTVNTHEDFHKILRRIVQHFLSPSS